MTHVNGDVESNIVLGGGEWLLHLHTDPIRDVEIEKDVTERSPNQRFVQPV